MYESSFGDTVSLDALRFELGEIRFHAEMLQEAFSDDKLIPNMWSHIAQIVEAVDIMMPAEAEAIEQPEGEL